VSAFAGVAAPRVRVLANAADVVARDRTRSAAALATWLPALAMTASAWLVWLAGQPSTGAAVRSGPHGTAAWMMTSLVALPVLIGGLWVATQLSRVIRGAVRATPLSVTLHPVLVSSAASSGLGTGWHLQTDFAGADPPVDSRPVAAVLVSPATLVATPLSRTAVAGLTRRSPRPRALCSRRSVETHATALDAGGSP
jgi:hypothetical protein